METWSRAVGQVAHQQLNMSQTMVQKTMRFETDCSELRSEVETLRQALQERSEEVNVLCKVRRSDEDAMRAATVAVRRSDHEAAQWQRERGETESAIKILRQQLSETTTLAQRLTRELALTEALMACADAMPKKYRERGLEVQGSWREPMVATGTEEQLAMQLTKRAVQLVREHAVQGYGVRCTSIRSALRRVLGSSKAAELLLECRIEDPAKLRLPLEEFVEVPLA
mmetsp:Transcript_43948/g.121604  ORF Transcript_43948/g.121604 Transcript_43948/m.121604 type:complete len:227 (-) Transcript_43948:13-693(-)